MTRRSNPSLVARSVLLRFGNQGSFAMTRSAAYASKLQNGEWVVLLPILGHGLPDEHPDAHQTKDAADAWIASDDGVEWTARQLARCGK